MLFGHYARCLQEQIYYFKNKNSSRFNISTEWPSEIYFEKERNGSITFSNIKCNMCGKSLSIIFILTPPWKLTEAEYNESKGL